MTILETTRVFVGATAIFSPIWTLMIYVMQWPNGRFWRALGGGLLLGAALAAFLTFFILVMHWIVG